MAHSRRLCILDSQEQFTRTGHRGTLAHSVAMIVYRSEGASEHLHTALHTATHTQYTSRIPNILRACVCCLYIYIYLHPYHTLEFHSCTGTQSRSVRSPLPRLFFLIRIHTRHVRESCRGADKFTHPETDGTRPPRPSSGPPQQQGGPGAEVIACGRHGFSAHRQCGIG